jgi:hypothetical protein
MRFTQSQKARFIGNTVKGVAALSFTTLIGYILYKFTVADK